MSKPPSCFLITDTVSSVREMLKVKMGQQDGVALAALVLLAFSVLLGGGSRQHEMRLALVEISALPLMVVAVMALLNKTVVAGRHRFALAVVVAVVALPLAQLVPLPPTIWTALPGRDQVILALEVTGIPQGWLPLTLTPDKTWRSFLALLPPLAMFLGVLAIRPESGLRLVHFLLIAILLSILLGAAQLASGSDRLHPWTTTDAGNVTGFFANRNHLATLCLVGIPFATVLGAAVLRRHSSSHLSLWLAVLYIILATVALAVIRSRAGVILFGPVLGVSLLAAWVAAGRGRPRPLLFGLVIGSVLAIVAIGIFAAGPILARFDAGGASEGRFENWPIVAEAAEAHLPFGTGIGSFDAIYRSVEPLERLDATYFNQAHNDYLETWLEAGWLGAALVIAFMIWFGRRALAAWRSQVSTARDLQRAATVAIGVVLLHSVADYPLRTAAMATVFAFCCGLLELAVRTDVELMPERPKRRRFP